MDKIRNVSGWLQKGFEVLVVLPVLASLLLWFFTKFPEQTVFGLPLVGGPVGFPGLSNGSYPILGDVTPMMRLGGFFVTLPLALLQTYWIWQLRQLFHSYSLGQIFTLKTTTYIRRTALAFLATPILGFFIGGVLSVILTSNNPVGQRMFSLSFGTQQVAEVLTGLVLVVIAWIMNEAQRLQEDVELTV